MSKLHIKIAPGGKVTLVPEGAPGQACRMLTAPFAQMFAGLTVRDVNTAEADEAKFIVGENTYDDLQT